MINVILIEISFKKITKSNFEWITLNNDVYKIQNSSRKREFKNNEYSSLKKKYHRMSPDEK